MLISKILNQEAYQQSAILLQLMPSIFCHIQGQVAAEILLHPQMNKTGDVWHIHLSNTVDGLLYGYKIDGPFLPQSGHRYNLNCVLIDPYAKVLEDFVHICMNPDLRLAYHTVSYCHIFLCKQGCYKQGNFWCPKL